MSFYPQYPQEEAISSLIGIGLRAEHEEAILREKPAVGWVEVHSENYFGMGSRPQVKLEEIREYYPVSLHGLGLGLGNVDSISYEHVRKLKQLVDVIEPCLVSDHLCWTAHKGHVFLDLLPLPYTREAAKHVASRIDMVQQALGRQILVENVSSYIQFAHNELSEWSFLTEVATQSNCRILLDVNNIYVNAHNHGYDALEFLNSIPADMIGEIHVAGHTKRVIDGQTLLIDTHDRPVSTAVWDIYKMVLNKTGPKKTLLEWDSDLPSLSGLVQEAQLSLEQLRKFGSSCTGVDS